MPVYPGALEPLGFSIAVMQLPFTALTSFLIHKSDLLNARVIIYSYNHHVGSFLPSLGRQATTVYSGRGRRHSYEIISTLRKPDILILRRHCAPSTLTSGVPRSYDRLQSLALP
jgi:hypothetical protein